MKTKRVVWISLLLVAVAIVIAILRPDGQHARLYSKARKQWKEAALADLAKRANDSQWLTNEIAVVRKEALADSEAGWVGANLLLMTNGEWFVYQNNCVKEPSHIHDLFLARASDGRWYYSTFHFCVDMIVLRLGFRGGQPDSIAEFAKTYFAKEFDGKSDECLQKTYPVEK